jgi:EF hand
MKTTSLLLFSAALLTLTGCQTTPTGPAGPDRFGRADANGDGELTEGEYATYVVAGIFDERDTNHDGVIAKAEWNPQMDAAESREFAARDSNKDGGVTIAEAAAYAVKTHRFSDDVKAADTNRNGTVNRIEATAYYASKEGPVR